ILVGGVDEPPIKEEELPVTWYLPASRPIGISQLPIQLVSHRQVPFMQTVLAGHTTSSQACFLQAANSVLTKTKSSTDLLILVFIYFIKQLL
ncbi:MAG TPA: hypothetical protein PLW44_08440, partial [Chitinophagales bacterium]|nr:hypothetical protein [Chitinophagales bacterium]